MIVGKVGPLGLIVRSSGLPDGDQIGSTAETATLWARATPASIRGPTRNRAGLVADPVAVATLGKDFLTSSPHDPRRAGGR